MRSRSFGHIPALKQLVVTLARRSVGQGAPSGIASVTFYPDGTKQLGTDTTSPYSISWTIPSSGAVGSHTPRAVAADVAGNSTTSTAITITVTRPAREGRWVGTRGIFAPCQAL